MSIRVCRTHWHDAVMSDVIQIYHIVPLQHYESDCFEEIGEFAQIIEITTSSCLKSKQNKNSFSFIKKLPTIWFGFSVWSRDSTYLSPLGERYAKLNFMSIRANCVFERRAYPYCECGMWKVHRLTSEAIKRQPTSRNGLSKQTNIYYQMDRVVHQLNCSCMFQWLSICHHSGTQHLLKNKYLEVLYIFRGFSLKFVWCDRI